MTNGAPPDPARTATSFLLAAWSRARPILFALAIGTIGGAIAREGRLPLAWMIGAMAAVTAAAVGGLEVRLPHGLRNVMVSVLAVMLGGSFTPEVVARMSQWTLSLGALAVWMALAAATSLVYFRKVAGYDPTTAFFSSTPGGMSEMTIIGGQMGGDERIISLTHASRILLVVSTIPVWYRFDPAFATAAPRPPIALSDVAPADWLVLAACALAGTLMARRLRLPAAFMVGPMVLSALAHLGGMTGSQPPDLAVTAAQVVVGTAIGCRFIGVAVARIAVAVRHAVATALLMLALTLAFGLGLAAWTGLPLPALILAFAPGGLAEMSLVALALSVDAAFVATHHVLRIAVVTTFAPVAFRLMGRRPPAPSG
ncbi:MAG: AbrB family transcriptional regulator [Pseudomonadota bacterium]